MKRKGYEAQFIAVRLHSMCEQLASSGIHINEKAVREAVKQLSKTAAVGLQYFLDTESTAVTVVRTHTTSNNTKSAKCIFIIKDDISSAIVDQLYSSELLIIQFA